MSETLKLPMSSKDFHLTEMKVKEEMNSNNEYFGEEFNRDTYLSQTTSIVDDIEIKHEEIGYGFNNTSTSDAEGDPEPKTVSSIQHLNCDSIQAEKDNDMSELYVDLLKCERDCETCLKYMRLLSQHVRATHVPPQPIRDPLHIDPLNIDSYPPHAEQSSSVQIKSNVDWDTYNSEHCEKKSKSEPDFESATVNESESDTDYMPYPMHKRTHGGERRYKCDVCKKRFTRSEHLTRHKRIHTGVKPYKCDECKKRFTDKSGLTTHMRIHTGVKPYACTVCEKSFTGSGDLTRHKSVHTGIKPFKCDVCEMNFKNSGNLSKHKRSHIHTAVKPFKCDVCEKSFTWSDKLAAHKRSHTGVKPFKCDVCEKSFIFSGKLSVHMRTHSGVKPYKCDDCEKSFSMSHHLVSHKRTHTGEKPYKCSECGKSFSVKSNLTVHKRIHTGMKNVSHRQLT